MFLLYLAQEFRSALKWWEREPGVYVWKQLDRRACLRFRFRETITSVWLDGSRTTISQREIRMYSNIRNSSKVPQKKPQKLHETGCFPTKMRLSRMDCATTTQSWNSVSFSQGWSREAPWDTFWQDAISWRRGGPKLENLLLEAIISLQGISISRAT